MSFLAFASAVLLNINDIYQVSQKKSNSGLIRNNLQTSGVITCNS